LTCYFCGKAIAEAFDYRMVSGWEPLRPPASAKGKSLNAQRRHSPEKFACARCVGDLKRNRTPGQETLLDATA
jgi:hypothetical protein